MNVSPAKPSQIIYTLYKHQYLGYMFASYMIQLDDKGRLTLSHQNISSLNAKEFDSKIDQVDYELIQLIDSMQQEAVTNHFNNKKKIKPNDFFLKIFNGKVKNELLQKEIMHYMEFRRSQILPALKGKMLFEMGEDGEPTWQQIEILPKLATILFHFRRNEENTHYFSTIKYNNEKIDFRYKGGFILCNNPAYIVIKNKLYHFAKNVDSNKIKPFLNKKFIVISKKIQDSYYRKFIAPLVGTFDVYAKGFDIKTENYEVKPIITFSELDSEFIPTLFKEKNVENTNKEGKILFELSFNYGNHNYKADNLKAVSVYVEQEGDNYIFHRIIRKLKKEKEVLIFLKKKNLFLKSSRVILTKFATFTWIRNNKKLLEESGITILQNRKCEKRYFLGESKIDIQITEKIDWFDIRTIIQFGEFEIPFKTIRKFILINKNEIKLPNGEIAIIPEEWFFQYSELFAFSKENEDGLLLKKHHISLVNELSEHNMVKTKLNKNLEKLQLFDKIENYDIPKFFKGKLRAYQKAGYNWMNFLQKYNFGGCLADDMGLGKTVQTLALLQKIKENGLADVNLLVMPTSLIYNWEKEAEKFTPLLKILNYTGVKRNKNISKFEDYDLVITSYGIIRQDIELLKEFHFLYAILDESQVIKNPKSNIAKAVHNLNATYRLILTGTPIENTTLDLWSQMNFLNPGLLGSESFFKNNFQKPIENKNNEQKIKKLYTIINPFLLRRTKDQVATDLPEKIETVRYCSMTENQEKYYDEVKSAYKNKIFEGIETGTLDKSNFMILQGLTKLRQIANHPRMVKKHYDGDSGKLKEISYMIEDAIQNKHKILVFSQFVKHLKIVSDYLKKQEIKFCYLDGQTKDRQTQVDSFQNNENLKVFLISLKAGGLGLNLTKANYVFILDPWWNPAIEAQAVDRVHRIGQKNQVFTYRFITKNTVEEKIIKLQKRKKKLATDLITTEKSFIKNLSKDDMISLLN